MSSIDNLINQAENQASQVPAPSTNNAVTTAAPVGAAPSLESMLASGGLDVDLWLKVSEDGLKIENKDGKKALFETVKVRIDLSDVRASKAIKYGNPVTYNKSYDGIVANDGITSWAEVVAIALRASPPGQPYDSADIAARTLEAVMDPKGNVVAEAGTTLGYSLSTTNRAAFTAFLKDVRAAGLDVNTSIVEVELGYMPKTNPKGNKWGIVTFKFLGEAEE